jgi:hypothetical protein
MNVRVLFAQGDVSVLAIAKLLKLSLEKCAPAGHVSFQERKESVRWINQNIATLPMA